MWNKQNAPCSLQNEKLYLRQWVLQAVKSSVVTVTQNPCQGQEGVHSWERIVTSWKGICDFPMSAQLRWAQMQLLWCGLQVSEGQRQDQSWPSFREATSAQRTKFWMHLRSTVVGDLCTMANTDKMLLEHYHRNSYFITQISVNDVPHKACLLVRVYL